MNTEFQNLPNVVSPKEVQTYFGISRSTTLSPDGCTAHVPDFPKIEVQTPTLDAALLEVKQQIKKALRQYKNPPIPTKQEQIVVPNNSVLVLVKAS